MPWLEATSLHTGIRLVMTELSGNSHSNLLEWVIPFLHKETRGSILFSLESEKEEVIMFLDCSTPLHRSFWFADTSFALFFILFLL